jgi:hypothetical protein
MFGTRAAPRSVAIVIAVLAGLGSGCGSEGPPEQTKVESPALTGTATYGAAVQPGDVTAKGVSGRTRTASNSSGTNQFTVSLEQLSPPYALSFQAGDERGGIVVLYGIATQAGTANVTPLTTLLIAQLLGQDPALAYAGFSSGGATNTSLVTEANIRDAQAKLVTYLQDVLGITVRAPTASFVTTSFNATAGDPMFDTMKALDDKLVATGRNFTELSVSVATLARLCLEEKILIAVGGQPKEFCPAMKAANPDEVDSTILNYVFSAPTNDIVTVRVRENEVLSAEYVTAAGQHYTCSATACGAIALGVPGEDLTRTLAFSNAPLTGDGGVGLMLNGTLIGAIPGIALPILPCDDNKFFVIKEDRSVVADCVETADPFGLGGTLWSQLRGAAPSRAEYSFGNSGTTHPGMPRFELAMDGNDSVVSAYYRELDPDTFVPTVQFACEGSACNGITLGPVTVNTDYDPSMPIYIRNVTFDDTVLAGLSDDGSAIGESATLKASVTLVYVENPSGPMQYPDLVDCTPGSDTVSVAAGSDTFNFCSGASGRAAFGNSQGGIDFVMNDDAFFTPITVAVVDGVVTRVTYSSSVFQNFYCSGNCVGVTVSAPDADGNRTLSFSNTALHEMQNFPRPGSRNVVLNGGGLLFPPP